MITSVNYMYKLENLEGENMTLEEIGLISYKTIGCYIFLIVILLAIAFFAVNKIFGKGGMVEKYKEADNEYNKTEIVDNLNLIIKEKYVLDYK